MIKPLYNKCLFESFFLPFTVTVFQTLEIPFFRLFFFGYCILYLPSPIWLIALIKDHLRLSLFDNLDKYFSYNLFVKLSYYLLGHIFYNTPSHLVFYLSVYFVKHFTTYSVKYFVQCFVKVLLSSQISLGQIFYRLLSQHLWRHIVSKVFQKTLYSYNLQVSLPSI